MAFSDQSWKNFDGEGLGEKGGKGAREDGHGWARGEGGAREAQPEFHGGGGGGSPWRVILHIFPFFQSDQTQFEFELRLASLDSNDSNSK